MKRHTQIFAFVKKISAAQTAPPKDVQNTAYSILFEIFTDPNNENEAKDIFISVNKIDDVNGTLKSLAKKVLGNTGIEIIKNITKK